MIHPTAIVDPVAKLGVDVSIGAYAVVEGRVEIGDRCVLRNHAVVRAGTVLGADVVVDSFAVLGGLPQSLTFDPQTPTGVRIGAHTVLREGVTINRSTREGENTVLGAHCFVMGNAHVGHDCRIGDHVVLGQSCMFGGHVEIGDYTFAGGGAAAHQFSRIGPGVMVGGYVNISLDLPPFTLSGSRGSFSGLNLVGLRRRGVPRETVAELKQLLSHVYHTASNPRAAAAERLEQEPPRSTEGRQFLEFFAGGTRGVARLRQKSKQDPE